MAEMNNEKVIKIPNKSEELAEFIGIMLGDGCVSAYKHQSNKNMNFSVSVTCHAIDDFDYITVYIGKLVRNLFGVEPYIYKHKKTKAIRLAIQSVRLVRFLNKMGLSNGNKIRNNQGIPPWIFSNKNYIKRCVRGLIDTDGSVFMCGNGSLFPRIGLDSSIPKLREDLRKSLLILGFNPLRWVVNKKISIYRKADVFKYVKEIGFSNQKHRKRFYMLNKAPVV